MTDLLGLRPSRCCRLDRRGRSHCSYNFAKVSASTATDPADFEEESKVKKMSRCSPYHLFHAEQLFSSSQPEQIRKNRIYHLQIHEACTSRRCVFLVVCVSHVHSSCRVKENDIGGSFI